MGSESISGNVVVGGCGIGQIVTVQTKIAKVGDGFGLLLPKELLDACGIGMEATVIVQNRTLIVAAQDWRPRQGWDEALERAAVATADESEDEETLAHWASLPASAELPRPKPNPEPEAVLHEESKQYGNRQDPGGA